VRTSSRFRQTARPEAVPLARVERIPARDGPGDQERGSLVRSGVSTLIAAAGRFPITAYMAINRSSSTPSQSNVNSTCPQCTLRSFLPDVGRG